VKQELRREVRVEGNGGRRSEGLVIAEIAYGIEISSSSAAASELDVELELIGTAPSKSITIFVLVFFDLIIAVGVGVGVGVGVVVVGAALVAFVVVLELLSGVAFVGVRGRPRYSHVVLPMAMR
jgi:hypothetical protein